MSEPNTNSWNYVEQLLQNRSALYLAIERETNSQAIMRGMLLAILVGAAAFGAAVGSYRGGIQTLYAGMKFPLVLLGTAAICAPVLTTLEMALGRRARWRRDLMLVAAAMAIGSLALVALAPLIVLGDVIGLSYHRFILLIGLCFCAAGGTMLKSLRTGIGNLTRSLALGRTMALLTVFAIVGMQMSWTFRPYVLRPRAEAVPFMRSLDGNLIDAAITSWRSARGQYSRDEAPLPEGS